jgi:hypothetical protein
LCRTKYFSSKPLIPFKLTRNQVEKIAAGYFQKRGIKLVGYKKSIFLEPSYSESEAKYILEKTNRENLHFIYQKELKLAHWLVRYFKPLQKEEFILKILPSGKVYSYHHLIEERKEAKSSSEGEALKKAQKYLTGEKKIKLDSYHLVGLNKEEKEKRVDYKFTWEKRKDEIGQAKFRISLRVQGEEVVDFEKKLHLPERWLRKAQQKKVKDLLKELLPLCFFLFLGTIMAVFWGRFFLQKQINWRLASLVAGGMVLGEMLQKINQLPTFFKNYQTDLPWINFIWQKIIEQSIQLTLVYALSLASFGLTYAIFKKYFSWKETKEILLKGRIFFLSLGITYLSFLFLIFLRWWFLKTSQVSFLLPLEINTYWPAFSCLFSSLKAAFWGSCLVTVGWYGWQKYRQKKRLLLLVLILVILLIAYTETKSITDFYHLLGQLTLLAFFILSIIKFFFKANLLVYPVFFFSFFAFLGGIKLVLLENFFFKWQGGLVLLFPFFLFSTIKFYFHHFLVDK